MQIKFPIPPNRSLGTSVNPGKVNLGCVAPGVLVLGVGVPNSLLA